MGLRNGLEVAPTECANGVDVGGERGGGMKNNSQFPVYQVHCCLLRWGKSGEKAVLGRDHRFCFGGRKLKRLAVSAVWMRVGPGWLEGSTLVAEGPADPGCGFTVALSQVAGGFSCRTSRKKQRVCRAIEMSRQGGNH